MEMEMALDVIEDDAFFADLSRRISLLIMEEEEEEDGDNHSHHHSVRNLQAHKSHGTPSSHSQPRSVTLGPFSYEDYKRETKGTGVFIPRASHSNKCRSRRSKHHRRKTTPPSAPTPGKNHPAAIDATYSSLTMIKKQHKLLAHHS